jgi:gas vesicle protein
MHMNEQTPQQRRYGFVIGLMAGTCVGAGLALWLAPRAASEIRERVTDSARSLGRRTSDRLEQASTRAGGTIGEIARTGRGLRNEAAQAVARTAREVERQATAIATKPL